MKHILFSILHISHNPEISCVLWAILLTFSLEAPGFPQMKTLAKGPLHPVGQELQLAKSKSLYVVIDTTKNIILLKARGIPLRTFPLSQSTWIGSALDSMTLHLTMKDPSVSPVPVTPPADSSSSPPEEPPKPLTVYDMPARYELVFQEQLILLVQPHHWPSFWENVRHQIAGWGERVAARIETWSGSRHYLVISLDPPEAQALYWSTVPPMNALIISENSPPD